LVTFGNRAYDNALAEMVGLMEEGGMNPVGASAMVTRHAFSDILGAGRPNGEDLAALDRFAVQVVEKLSTVLNATQALSAAESESIPTKNYHLSTIDVPGEAHPESYYTPLKTNNAHAGFLKAKPSCNSQLCTRCGECLDVCPMGSIGAKDGMPTFDGICIKCQACRRRCPTGAIAFTDPEYLSHVAMIEHTFAAPKRAEFFVAETTNNQ
ncbi:MAG: 4Fe-4S binding protein, partial [Bacteroidales bacterium]|nr:4Fe-4S binding protein [Bacteroidales bacterium]